MKASYETHESVPTPQLPEKKKRNVNFKAGSCMCFLEPLFFHRSIVRFGFQFIYMYIYTCIYIILIACLSCEFCTLCLVGAPVCVLGFTFFCKQRATREASE